VAPFEVGQMDGCCVGQREGSARGVHGQGEIRNDAVGLGEAEWINLACYRNRTVVSRRCCRQQSASHHITSQHHNCFARKSTSIFQSLMTQKPVGISHPAPCLYYSDVCYCQWQHDYSLYCQCPCDCHCHSVRRST